MLKTSEIMTTNVVTIAGAANVYQAVKLMQEQQVSSLRAIGSNGTKSYVKPQIII
jgi:predicted transcriptional regulator